MGQQNPTVMISLGGNAISPKNESGDISKQFAHTKESLDAIMYFVDNRYNICIYCIIFARKISYMTYAS